MKKYIILFILSGIISAGCFGNASAPRNPKKSSTEKRIKKQQKHRKKHECPQLDC